MNVGSGTNEPVIHIGQKVFAHALEIEGVITGQFTGRQGTQYLVEYKNKEGTICERYFTRDELA